MPRGIYKHKTHSPEQNLKIGNTVSALWKDKRKGRTYEEIFGIEKAAAMKEKMRLAKLGRKMPWNSQLGLRGEQTPRWIKDRSKVKKRYKDTLTSTPYKYWRMAVFKRDDFNCRIGEDCKGQLEAHHILPWAEFPELRFTLTNGITLCHAHHPRRRAEVKRLESFFKKLVSSAEK